MESLFQFSLFEKYIFTVSKDKRDAEDIELCGLYNFIRTNTLFVNNQIADDILKEYIDDFENNDLNISEKKSKKTEENTTNEIEATIKQCALSKKEQNENYLNYNKLISMLVDIFGNDYDNCGSIININNKTLSNNKENIKCSVEQIRIYELLLSLAKNKNISINKISCKNNEFSINIEFFKHPRDIDTERKNWIVYGDLRVNKDLLTAQYKNKNTKKFNRNADKFKVLCYLIENPDVPIDVEKLIEITKLQNVFNKYKKQGRRSKLIEDKIKDEILECREKIKGYIIDIQEELGITKDEERTIQISQSNSTRFILHKLQK